MLEEILTGGFAELGLAADEEALARYRTYYERLSEVNKVMNLTAISGEEDTARLHFLDCAALLTALDLRGKRVIDVGTGAGFPGLAVKVACPDMDLTLLDSLDKRIGFLRETCAALDFDDVACIHARAEDAPAELREGFDAALSRAVARLNVLCELCLPFVKVGGCFVAMKAAAAAEELAEAKLAISLLGGKAERVVTYRIGEAEHCAVVIRKVRPTPPAYPRRFSKIKQSPL